MPLAWHLGDRCLRLDDGRRSVEHLDDAFGAHRGAGDEDHHEGGHHDSHDDLGEVAQECDQRADLHLSVVDPVGAEPQHGDARRVEDQDHDREEECLQPPGHERRVGEVGVDVAEPLRLGGFADEGAHHADAGDLLAEHAVDGVDAFLHLAELRHHPRHDHEDADHQHRDADRQDPRQPTVLANCHDDPADRSDRSGDEQGARHQHEHLHLLHVVGDAGDQRRCAELAHLAGREVGYLMEDAAAHIAAESHRCLGAEEHRCCRADDLHQRDQQHQPTDRPDVAGVARGDTLVDDVGVEARQVERGECSAPSAARARRSVVACSDGGRCAGGEPASGPHPAGACGCAYRRAAATRSLRASSVRRRPSALDACRPVSGREAIAPPRPGCAAADFDTARTTRRPRRHRVVRCRFVRTPTSEDDFGIPLIDISCQTLVRRFCRMRTPSARRRSNDSDWLIDCQLVRRPVRGRRRRRRLPGTTTRCRGRPERSCPRRCLLPRRSDGSSQPGRVRAAVEALPR